MDSCLDKVMTELKKAEGIDLACYRRAMLERRLAARMAKLQITDPPDYLAHLRSDPDEPKRLLDAFSIQVSAFFRNSAVFESLAKTVLPEIIDRKRIEGYKNLRVWSAGCAMGEEAYSVAMLIRRVIDKKKADDLTVDVFATDISSAALERAETAIYARESLKQTKLGFIDEYFVARDGDRYEVRRPIRDMVHFSRDNLASPNMAAPTASVFGTFDLVLCRNVLIYFSAGLQDRTLGRLCRSLADRGYLVLGDTESPGKGVAARLKIIDSANNIFQKRR